MCPSLEASTLLRNLLQKSLEVFFSEFLKTCLMDWTGSLRLAMCHLRVGLNQCSKFNPKHIFIINQVNYINRT